ncbi:MAG: hypothetical protein ACTSPB_05640 [Candidatus Thorarchaeota archaeon]
MSNIDDLNYTSISDMSADEGIELLRQIRLSRRIPVKKVSTTTKTSPKKTSNISAEAAAELLKILGG